MLSAETGDFDVFGLFVNRLVVDDVGAALLLGAGLVGGALVAADFEPTVKSYALANSHRAAADDLWDLIE